MDLNLPKARIARRDAGFFKRLLAFAIDFLILNLIVFTHFQKIFYQYFPENITFSELMTFIQKSDLSGLYTALFFMAILSLAYFTFFEYKLGQTPGMMIVKLKVVSTQPKVKLGFWKAVLRNIYVFPYFPFSLLWIVEPLMVIFKRERILELITKTKTIEEVLV